MEIMACQTVSNTEIRKYYCPEIFNAVLGLEIIIIWPDSGGNLSRTASGPVVNEAEDLLVKTFNCLPCKQR